MWIDEIKLIKKVYKNDSIGNQIEQTQETIVIGEKKSISKSEFYQASQSRLKPAIIFKIHTFEYNDEEYIIYNNQEYKVMKTYEVDANTIELTCEKVIA